MDDLSIKKYFSPGVNDVIIVKLTGYVDHSNSRQVEQVIAEILNSGKIKIIFDFSELVYMSSAGWGVLIDVLGAGEEFRRGPGRVSEKNVVSFVFADYDNSGSIISSLRNARENMRTTREVMPKEVWERINSLYLSVAQRRKRGLPRSLRHRVLNDVIQRCQQINGMLSGGMAHEDGYNFMVIGRNLERADMSTRIVDVGSARLVILSRAITDFVLASLYQNLKRIGLITLAVWVVSLFLALLLARTLVKPIKRLIDGMRKAGLPQ